METFPDRLRLQKIVWLMQKFGVRLGFTYSWYLHGPYSPELTRNLYEIVQSGILPYESIGDRDLARIESLRKVLGADITSCDKLELLASIDFLKHNVRSISKEDAEHFLKETKPYFSDQLVQECWQRSLDLDSASTS
jgi:uncharacterized protein YwgA